MKGNAATNQVVEIEKKIVSCGIRLLLEGKSYKAYGGEILSRSRDSTKPCDAK